MPADRPRVLLGNLEPMVRLGMSGILEQDGVEVVGDGDHPAAIVEQAARLRPDAVILLLDDEEALTLGGRIRAAAPEAKLILWARNEDEMRVFDPGRATPRLIRSSLQEALRSEFTPRHAPT